MFSDTEIYDIDNEEHISWDDLVQELEDDAYDDFDVRDHLDDEYSSLEDLWDAIEMDGMDDIKDSIWDGVREKIYSNAYYSRDHHDSDGRFDIDGHNYKLMRRWELSL